MTSGAHDHKAPPEAAQDEARLDLRWGTDRNGGAFSIAPDGNGLWLTVMNNDGWLESSAHMAIDDVAVGRSICDVITRWLDSKAHHHPNPAAAEHAERSDAQASEDVVDHITDRNGRPLGCDVCRHATARFNGGNGATTCSELDDRIVAVGTRKPNFRPLGCPFNGGG